MSAIIEMQRETPMEEQPQRGRSQAQRRKKYLDVGFSPDTYEQLQQLCKDIEIPLATFVRDAALDKAAKVRRTRRS
jgi:hypothetical protein